MKTITQAWQIPIPSDIPADAVNFTFSTAIKGIMWQFSFKWMIDHWAVFVLDANGVGREAAVFPSNVAWWGFDDYGVAFKSDLDSIGLTDLAYMSMYVLEWG
jgi:hypothetical protein